MSDRMEMKRLAEGAVHAGDHWGLRDSFERQLAKLVGPETVLALIAECERIKARLCVCRDCGGRGEIYSGHSSYQGHNQPPEPDMDVCGTCGGDGVLGPLEDFEALAAERDKLKTDNEAMAEFKANMVGLRETHGFDSWAAVLVELDRLKAEIDGLHAQHDRDSGELRKLCAARDSARRQRDQLKVENDALRSAGAGALRFVAFAFDEGVEGAEQAGRAIENAIGAKS